MNERAFRQPPVMEFTDGVWRITVEAYHWCGHPRWGYSINTFDFPTFEDAEKHMKRLGFSLQVS